MSGLRTDGMIYLDHNATTPVDERVLAAMLPVFTQACANPASSHRAGRAAAALVARARHQVASAVGAPHHRVIFTSGATEAANLAIRGLFAGRGLPAGRGRILVGATEHPAVTQAARLAIHGGRGSVGVVAVGRDGILDLDHLQSLLDENVALVAVMAANNETGALNDLKAVCRLAHEAGALVLADVTQAVGKVTVALADWSVDLAVLSSHKIYGPQGVGAVVAEPNAMARLAPLIVGGGQERGLRAGTLNTPGIVGFGAAAAIAAADRVADARRLSRLSRLLYQLLTQRLDAVTLNGPASTRRLPNTLNLRFAAAPADAVLTCVSEVAISAGSACHAGSSEPSPVLLAMGLDRAAALESLRFSLGRGTTEVQVRRAAELVVAGVEHVRQIATAMARWRGTSSRRSTAGTVPRRGAGREGPRW